MMMRVEGFLKQHKRQLVFDNARKEISPDPRFSISQKAYLEITQWQRKKIGRLTAADLVFFKGKGRFIARGKSGKLQVGLDG